MSTRSQFRNILKSFTDPGWILSAPRDLLLFILSADSKISSTHTFVWDSLSNFSSSKKEFSVGPYLCSSRVNIITRNYLSFFTANTLFSSSSPFAPSYSINSTDSLANFLFLDVSEDDFTVSFYSVSKLFLKTFLLACRWFYIYDLHWTYWCLNSKEFADKLNAKIIHGSRRTGSC